MSPSVDNEVVIRVKDAGIDEELTGIREGRFVRLPLNILERFSSIKRQLVEEKGTLNNIWGIIESETGELLTSGQKLYAQIRIKKESGKYAIAATTVVLGTVVAVTIAQRSHKKR